MEGSSSTTSVSPCCIICWRKYSKGKPKPASISKVLGDKEKEQLKRFFNLLERYVGSGDKGTIGKERDSMEQLINNGMGACNECTTVVKSFCELYQEMKSVELQVKWRVWTLKNIMESAAQVPQRVDTFKETVKRFREEQKSKKKNESGLASSVISFKTELVKNCSRKINKSFPKPVVKNCRKPSSVKTLASSTGGKIYECTTCHAVFINPDRLKEHKLTAHRNMRFKCGYCDILLRNKASVRKHITTIHKTDPSGAPCDPNNMTLVKLTKENKHHARKPYRKRSGNLNTDVSPATKKRRPGRPSKSIGAPTNYFLKIEGSKPYQCKVCFKSFKHITSVYLHHQSSHQGIRHKCGYCSSTFSQRGYARVHIFQTHKDPSTGAPLPMKITTLEKPNGKQQQKAKNDNELNHNEIYSVSKRGRKRKASSKVNESQDNHPPNNVNSTNTSAPNFVVEDDPYPIMDVDNDDDFYIEMPLEVEIGEENCAINSSESEAIIEDIGEVKVFPTPMVSILNHNQKNNKRKRLSPKPKGRKSAKDPTSVFKCEDCGMGFSARFNLNRHKQNKVCQNNASNNLKSETSSNSLSSSSKKEKVTFSCKICKKKFKYSIALSKHMKTEHAPPKQQQQPQKKEEGVRYQCQFCPLTLPDQLSLQNHVISLHIPNLDLNNIPISS